METIICKVCGSDKIFREKGCCRDNENIYPMRCKECGHISLSNFSGVVSEQYTSGDWKSYVSIDDKTIEDLHNADHLRDFQYSFPYIKGKNILDFGSGKGDFLMLAKQFAKSVTGIDLDCAGVENYKNNNIPFYPHLEDLPEGQKFDVITMFLVLDQIAEPLSFLKNLLSYLNENGVIIIEVASADDALITYYKCEAFLNFTWFASHLHLFSIQSIKHLISSAGLKLEHLKGLQRYPLANHLYWLSEGKPAGEKHFTRISTPLLDMAYADLLSKNGLNDTIIAVCSKK